ncbi:dienelactone hydrolase [Mesorhizobium sp. B2-3-4]|uniref:alpha/beta hydrolase family protein n=1 Tax=Mesorhizobium sp. B2-3-4 TaxID=2589959 RepID=UPI001126FC91|nr:dienelactone hydrolase [Mesorhizobium sp. B2-3-4]TPM27470.1 dienelactone hydrolase [Mesorhizobium sp. B2-3-4]
MTLRIFIAVRKAEAQRLWSFVSRSRSAIFVGLVLISGLCGAMPTTAATPVDPNADSSVADKAADRSPVGFETVRIPNGAEPPLVAGVWYPTSAEPRDVPLENFTQRVAPSGPVEGSALPLIVISHGGGGSYAGHYDTAIALARAGFVVAAVSHAGDTYDDQSKVLMLWRRPAQLSRLIDFMLKDWRGHAAIDQQRIGAFGFSNGGFAVLVEAGGIPELGRIDPYCAANPKHDLCITLAKAGVQSVAGALPPPDVWKPDPRIRAIAAAAPSFGFTFDRAGLASVQIPVLLWGAADDRHQPGPWYEEHIRSALPRPPQYHVEPMAGHYAFLPPCGARLRAMAPGICVDAPGFDRAAFHRRLNAALVRFFRTSLRS